MVDFRINRDTAERIIARFLREKISSVEANSFASKICDSLQASMSSPTRVAPARDIEKGLRLIPSIPPKAIAKDYLAELQSFMQDIDPTEALEIWRTVFRHGRAP